MLAGCRPIAAGYVGLSYTRPSPFSSVATGWGAVRTVWFVHGLGVLESPFLACSALAARSLKNSRTFRLPGIGEPSAVNLMRPIVSGPTGLGSGFSSFKCSSVRP